MRVAFAAFSPASGPDTKWVDGPRLDPNPSISLLGRLFPDVVADPARSLQNRFFINLRNQSSDFWLRPCEKMKKPIDASSDQDGEGILRWVEEARQGREESFSRLVESFAARLRAVIYWVILDWDET